MVCTNLSMKIGRSTHRIISVLAHAMLEWILISLLLLNSLFYHSINRFATFFRLKPTCLWCTTAIFKPRASSPNNTSNDSQIFCEAHSALISDLSYCANHKQLVNSKNVCVDCVFSGLKSESTPTHCCQYASLCARIMKISAASTTDDDDDDRLMKSQCSCCGKSWGGEFCSRGCDFLTQGLLDSATQKENITCEEMIVPQSPHHHSKNEEEYKFPDYQSPSGVSDARRSIYLREANVDSIEEEDFIKVDFDPRQSSCDNDDDDIKNNHQLRHVNGESLQQMDTRSDVSHGKQGDGNETSDAQDKEERKYNRVMKLEEEDEKKTECIEVLEAETHAVGSTNCCNSDIKSSKWQTCSVITADLDTHVEEVMDVHRSGQLQDGILSSYSHDKTQANHDSDNTLRPFKNSNQGDQNDVVVEDPYLEIVRLRSDLESEKNTRSQLTLELEAERNASAVSANQTMAMITRLQEEKSAIKTEALQYQRMMEEQAEYDQEALQLLNELVIKREKEKRELEEELDMCNREMKLMKENRARSERSSSSRCTVKDIDRKDDQLLLSPSDEMNGEIDEEMVGKFEYKEDELSGEVLTTVDNVLDRVKSWNMLDGSLEDFEEERTSILQQLKELEERLYTLCEEDEFEEVEDKPLELNLTDAKCEELGEEENSDAMNPIDLCSKEVNLQISGDGCIVQSNSMALAAQKLLPMLESGQECASDNGINVQKQEILSVGVRPRDESMQEKILAIVKEMDHVYGRLHALEADREFLRHCVSSLDKGDKGIDLLREILAHLRELRAEENCGLLICKE